MQTKTFLITTSMAIASALYGSIAFAANPNAQAQAVFDFWTPEQMAAAQPRDLVLDPQGKAYMRIKGNTLMPYGHSQQPELQQMQSKAVPKARPGGGDNTDTSPPAISSMQPADGATIGSNATFSAVVTDPSGVRSVDFQVNYGGQNYTFAGTHVGNDVWEVNLQGFNTGSGSWYVEATDGAKRGGNTGTSGTYTFTVGSTPPPPTGDIVTNARWSFGGDIQTSAGRLYYQMASKRGKQLSWAGYVCSGTVTNDAATGRSIIITAAHCVYNDESKTFARNVLFIPNQDQTTGTGTDGDCSNDPVGCWTASFGVVEQNWTTRTFPDNIPWDYAYYVVDDNGAHSGAGAGGALDTAVGGFDVSFTAPAHDDGQPGPASIDWTHNLGYSYSDDPFFMYSAQDMTELDAANWWQSDSDLSGGSSGGPWIQPMNESTGSGPIISVNSWGYTTSPGMAGPKLSGTTAECVFDAARTASMSAGNNADGAQGVIVDPATCN